MIERLMNQEFRYGEPEYSHLEKEIQEMKDVLAKQLDEEGWKLLDQLSSAYIRQGHAMLNNAFADGFCTAVKLMMDVILHEKK